MATEAEKKEESRAMIARIDERTQNMWRTLDEADDSIKKQIDRVIGHMEKQNGRVRKLEIGLVSLASILTGAGILDATIWNKVIGG